MATFVSERDYEEITNKDTFTFSDIIRKYTDILKRINKKDGNINFVGEINFSPELTSIREFDLSYIDEKYDYTVNMFHQGIYTRTIPARFEIPTTIHIIFKTSDINGILKPIILYFPIVGINVTQPLYPTNILDELHLKICDFVIISPNKLDSNIFDDIETTLKKIVFEHYMKGNDNSVFN